MSMGSTQRRRRTRVLLAEGLEPRTLLAAAFSSAAEIRAMSTTVPKTLKGTIHGQVTSVTTEAPGVTLVTYAGSGNIGLVGKISVTGHHTVTKIPGKKNTSTDSYSAGFAVLTSSVVVIDATYVGSGRTMANGKSSATLIGTATAVTGTDAGLSGAFTAKLTGNARGFTMTFTLRT
jgi:hypothetical protein